MSRDTDSTRRSVLVGIPAFNEAATIGDVVTAARRYADEVLVVDDGSDDGTRERAEIAGATLVSHHQNKGYGAALATIFSYAYEENVDHLIILDADGQHEVEDIPDLLQTQSETGAEIVTGSRFNGTDSAELPIYRRFGLVVVNLLTNIGLRVGYAYPSISDTQCGFRAYNREAIRSLAAADDIGSGMGASLDILFRAAREDYEIVEVPTEIDYEVEEANTRNPLAHGVDLLVSLFLAILRDRPVRFASIVAVVAVSVGTLGIATTQSGGTAVKLLIPTLFAVVFLSGVALMVGSHTRADATDQE